MGFWPQLPDSLIKASFSSSLLLSSDFGGFVVDDVFRPFFDVFSSLVELSSVLSFFFFFGKKVEKKHFSQNDQKSLQHRGTAAVLLTGRKNKRGRRVVAEPVGAGGVVLVAVDSDHDVPEAKDLGRRKDLSNPR